MRRGASSTLRVLSVVLCLLALALVAASATPEENGGVVAPGADPVSRDLQPTWTGGMGAIFESRCMECHRPGGAAPMSFLTYSDVKKWTKAMRVSVATRAMPPWPADPAVGHFRNSRRLTQRELDLFDQWASAGFPRGDGEHELETDWTAQWQIGEPDAVFELPEYTVGDQVTEEIRALKVKTDFPEDRWIVANEAQPGDEYTVIHIDGGVLGSYYPGNSSEVLEPGRGYLLPAGAQIEVQVLYRKEKGYEVTETSRLGVRFARDPSTIHHRVDTHRMANSSFTIPAGVKTHVVESQVELEEDSEIVSLRPVMQMRGKSIRYQATFPDGREKVLLSIPDWDPLWKYRYQLAKAVAAPRGTVVKATATYDNSADNLRNPDPGADVSSGPGGELLEGWLGVARPVEVEAVDTGAGGVTAEVDLVPYRRVHTETNGSADSALSPDGRWFAFASRRSGNLDVWLVSTESGELKRITRHPTADYEARWHPDGRKLVFVTHRNGSQDVYTRDLDSGEETPIATETFNEDYPSFSKDGREIVFTGGPGGFREVQVYNYESGEIRTVTKGFGWVGSTNFSPDGKLIVFHAYYDRSYNSGKSDIFIVPARGGEVKNITRARDVWDYKANWSYDGDWIAFSSKRASPDFNLFVMAPDGSKLRQITDFDRGDLRWANWTRDGRLGWHRIEPQEGRLRAVSTVTGEALDVVTSEDYISDLTASPSGDALLYETAGKIYVLPSRPDAEARELLRGLRPRWSRDGEKVSFLRYRRGEDRVSEAGLGSVARDGEGSVAMAWVSHVTVAESPEPWRESGFRQAWSPDGQTLARILVEGDREDLVLTSQDGTTRPLTRDGESKSSPVWSADGQYVFYVENRPRSVSYYMTTEKVVSK